MRRPPKPRIVKQHLSWKWNKTRGVWDPYHRVTKTVAGKRTEHTVKLDWQGDPQKLDALYWACRAGRHEAQKTPARYTWRELIEAWRRDTRVQSRLSDSTKRSYRRSMDAILEKNGTKDVRRTTRQGVRAAHEKLSDLPRKADHYLQAVSLLWNFGKNKLDWPMGDNPASGIEHFGKRREYEPWPNWLVEKLPEAPKNVRTAAELILGTGQRPNAAINMRRDQFKGEWMTVVDEKGRSEFEIYCPVSLRTYIATLPKSGTHVLAKNLTEPLGYSAVEKAFRTWRNGYGDRARPYSLHGLRKLAIVRLAETGASDAEIQAVTGQSAEMVAYYRARANRRKLSKSAQERNETKT